MKVVLISPTPTPIFSKKHSEDTQIEGLGLLYLATSIKDHHDVSIIEGTRPIPTETIIEEVTRLEPDIVGISTIFSSLMLSGEKIAREIRKRFPRTKIIYGGNHATFTADELARKDYVDVVVVGEADLTFPELVAKMDRGQSLEDVKGIVFREDGKFIRTEPRPAIQDVNTVPFPDWTIVTDKIPKSIKVCSSRGCPHDCIYCSTTAFWGRKWRPRTAQNIIDEINYVLDVYKPEKRSLGIGFVDDNFTVDKGRVMEFCRLIDEQDAELQWGASSRIELIDRELLRTMAASGCNGVFLGVESGSDRVLKMMKRRYSAEEVREKVEMCLDVGIIPTCSFMIGNPYEDRSDIERSLSLLKELRTYKVQVHIFSPLIGTEIFKYPDKFGAEILTDQSELMNPEEKAFLNTKYMKAEEVEDLFQRGVGFAIRRHREKPLIDKLARTNRERLRVSN